MKKKQQALCVKSRLKKICLTSKTARLNCHNRNVSSTSIWKSGCPLAKLSQVSVASNSMKTKKVVKLAILTKTAKLSWHD